MSDRPGASGAQSVPSYCYQCVSGPDLFRVRLEGGVPREIQPNFEAEAIHPGRGRVCVKAYGLLEKVQHPDRILQPMKRTNPRKANGEDPRFEPISWDEALGLLAEKLAAIRAGGVVGADGFPRLAVTFGGGGTPAGYMGTLPALLSAWGPIDYSFGSGQGVKCTHSEHVYGEFWHRGFTVAPDTPSCRLVLSFGSNIETSGGVAGARRHADARVQNGLKRIQFEPQLSITGGASAEWVPIRPKTDAAFMFAMIHVLLHETSRDRLDTDHLRARTSSPYLVAPHGFYLRDPASRKPLVWDPVRAEAVPFDTPGIDPCLEGEFAVAGLEVGVDGQVWSHAGARVRTAFSQLVSHFQPYTPEWAEGVCDVPAATTRRVAGEYLGAACVGQTIEIDGVELPFRPVAITLGRTVNNGWGGFEACWARTMLAALVGALEVPGGLLGTTVRLTAPGSDRHDTVRPGADGFMDFPFNFTDAESWEWPPRHRNGYKSLVPLLGRSAWSAALGPTHLAWLFQREPPPQWPRSSPPDVWLVYRANPVISGADSELVADVVRSFPFTVCFAYTRDETNDFADLLLPDATDLESTQLFRIGGNRYPLEHFWEHEGFALRAAAASPRGSARDISDVVTELAGRLGMIEAYNTAINRGRVGVALSGQNYDFSLDTSVPHASSEVWHRACQAASAELSDGTSSDGLDWYREHGFKSRPFSRRRWYLHPTMVERQLRFELPYQERLHRIGGELRNRLHEKGIHWWDSQLAEYVPLPVWNDFPGKWTEALVMGGGSVDDHPFWLIGGHSMQYATGSNASSQLMSELAAVVRGHAGVIMNAESARRLGIRQGDVVEVYSPRQSTRGRVHVCEGIRPDTLFMLGQFGHTVTPVARELQAPSLSLLIENSLELTDATGSTADVVRVGVRRVRGGR